jgi:hypothetical protein
LRSGGGFRPGPQETRQRETHGEDDDGPEETYGSRVASPGSGACDITHDWES